MHAKPMLGVNDLVTHLRGKGVDFNIMSEAEANTYLCNNNNFFKLTSYRKNYSKYTDGKNAGKYECLDFAYLIELAIDLKSFYASVECVERGLDPLTTNLVVADSTKTEKTILENLRATRAGKTTILIAHRISTIEQMDKVLFIDDGTVAAFGKHEELYETCNEYRKMVDLQRLEEEGGEHNG